MALEYVRADGTSVVDVYDAGTALGIWCFSNAKRDSSADGVDDTHGRGILKSSEVVVAIFSFPSPLFSLSCPFFPLVNFPPQVNIRKKPRGRKEGGNITKKMENGDESSVPCQNAIVCGGEVDHSRDTQDLCINCRVITMDGYHKGLLDKYLRPPHYVYVLASRGCGGWYYIGVTGKLPRRLHQHASHRGSQCTRRWNYDTLVALYKYPFSFYREEFETKMTYRWMHAFGRDWFRIRGGPYCEIKTPRNRQTAKPPGLLHAVQSDPFIGAICDCGYPPALETRGSSKNCRFLICPVPVWYNSEEYFVETGCTYRVPIDKCGEIYLPSPLSSSSLSLSSSSSLSPLPKCVKRETYFDDNGDTSQFEQALMSINLESLD